jgi:hypothetical protein
VAAGYHGRRQAIRAVARRAATPVLALFLGATAMALVLDSGTGHLPAHLRSIGLGPGAQPQARVAVSSPAPGRGTQGERTQGRAAQPRTSAVPAATPVAGVLVLSSGRRASSPGGRPAHRPSTGGSRSTTPPGPGGGAAGPATPTPTTQPHLAWPPRPAPQQASDLSPGPACEPQGRMPPGLTPVHRNHVPPGLAREHLPFVPPGQARKRQSRVPAGWSCRPPPGHERHGPPAQAPEEDRPGPGHDGHGEGHRSHGRGH